MLMQSVRRCCQTISTARRFASVQRRCILYLPLPASGSWHAHLLQSHLSLQPGKHIFLFLLLFTLKVLQISRDVFQLHLSLIREASFVHIHLLTYRLMCWTVIIMFIFLGKFFAAAVADCSHHTFGLHLFCMFASSCGYRQQNTAHACFIWISRLALD